MKYVEPLSVNGNALGLEIGAHPERRLAAEKAVLRNDATLTGVIHLV